MFVDPDMCEWVSPNLKQWSSGDCSLLEKIESIKISKHQLPNVMLKVTVERCTSTINIGLTSAFGERNCSHSTIQESQTSET